MFRQLCQREKKSATVDSTLNVNNVELSDGSNTKDIVQSITSHSTDQVVESGETEKSETVKSAIPTFESEDPTFQEIYIKAPEVMNYILENYKTENPANIIKLLYSTMLHCYAKTSDIDLRSFLLKKLLKCRLATVLLELWEYYWTNDFLDQQLNGSFAVAHDWTNLMLGVVRLTAMVSNTNSDAAKEIIQIGLFQRLLQVLESDKLSVKRCRSESIITHDNGKLLIKWFDMTLVISSILLAISNCLRWFDCLYEAKPIFRANQGMAKMQLVKEVSSGKDELFEDWFITASLSVAYTLEENEQLDDKSMSILINFLCTNACEAVKQPDRTSRIGSIGWELSECVVAINVLMNSDRCKEELCQNAMLFDCISEGIRTNIDEAELLALVRCLYLLSFIEKGKQVITEHKDLTKELQVLKTHKNKDVKQNAEGTSWNVSGQRPADFRTNLASKLNLETQSKQQHIMISYDWNHQKIAAALNLQLKSMGYYTWMDIDRMSGSTLESMAEAVEQSAVVIICFSERYKNSPNCRKEASYADDLKKPIIPVKTDLIYKPDGWLGMMLAKLLFYTCTSVDLVPSVILNIAKELGDRGKLGQHGQMAVANILPVPKSSEDQIAQMSCEELTLQFERVKWNVPIDNLNGAELVCLYQLHKRSPKDFLEFLRCDMGIKDGRIQLRLMSYMMDINKLRELL